MGKYVGYTVVQEEFMSDLTSRVKNLMREGWEPQGGVQYFERGGLSMTSYYIQAMVLKNEN